MRITFLCICLTSLFVVCLASGCKKAKEYTTIPLESMLTLRVVSESGQNLDPFSDSELRFIGFPAAIAYAENLEDLPFLVFGKQLKRGDKHICVPVATISFLLEGEMKFLGVGIPVDKDNRSLDTEGYNNFATDYSEAKLWISDYLNMAYREKGIDKIKWNNESEVYRQLKEYQTK